MQYRSILVFAALASLSPLSCADITLYLTPAKTTVSVGEPLVINLGIYGLETGPALAGYDVDIGYEPQLTDFRDLRLGDPQLGTQLHLDQSAPPSESTSRQKPGAIRLLETSLDSPSELERAQHDSFLLAILTFEARIMGRAHFTLTLNGLSDAAGQTMTANTAGASVAIVPTPATCLLMASGLLPMFLWLAAGNSTHLKPFSLSARNTHS